MNQKELKQLGLDMKKNGQREAIILFEGKILDGRNRYLACKMFNITPKFVKYKEEVDPLIFILSKNLHRSHLNSAQRCEIALELVRIERKKAKARQLRTQFKRKDKGKNTVEDPGYPTVEDQEKGRSVDIAAKKAEIAPKTLKKVIKIKELAEKSPEIKKKWEKAKKNKLSIESIYKDVKEKEEKTGENGRKEDLKLTCKDCDRRLKAVFCPLCKRSILIFRVFR